MRRTFSLLLVAAVLAACQDTSRTPTAIAPDGDAALSAGNSDVIPGQFIVTLRAGASPAAVARDHGVEPRYTYQYALNGFAGSISEAARSGLLRDARVLRIEADAMAYPGSTTTQTSATWGLDRIDQRDRPLNGTYTYTRTGTGVTVYVIDSGIRFAHNEFGTRASLGRDFVLEEDPSNAGDGSGDCNGHGTHVAGTIGGTKYGVAKSVDLVSVRVFGCSGGAPFSRIIAAVDWVTGNAKKPAVANMSLGGGGHTATDDAVRASIRSGISYAVAAGNDSQDACRYTPARVREAMTIGSTTSDDSRSSFSNVGDCVDWFAPGSSITSAWSTSNTATRTISGTSMAAPHAAGVAALYLQGTTGVAPATVKSALFDLTTKGVVSRARSTNNHLLFSLVNGGGGSDGGESDGGGGGGTEPCVPKGKGNNCK
jgi:aqualysin 1